jgi:hypothetical protein
MKRRDFVKTGVAATSGLFFVDSFLGCVNPDITDGKLQEFFAGFQEPPVTSRVFVRWWWNGNRLSEKEILRELDVMKEAGIGGVEINPIAFPREADPSGYESLVIFEDKWLDMLKVALEGAKERGMICDMIVGSGWPFGAEFLEKQDQVQMVTIETVNLEGGRTHHFKIKELLDRVDPEISSKNQTVYKDLVMARLMPANSDEFTGGKDLLQNTGNEVLTVDVPEGNHILYCVVKLTGYMAVIQGAPGASGPVLNHYSKTATENYLNKISGYITGRVGDMGNYIRSVFCDSMELEGANWNDDLPDEFEKRRGYSLWPYLPFVLTKVGHMGEPVVEDYGTKFSGGTEELINRVRLDFYKTRIELFKERFVDTFNEWCHRNHVLSRMQAYGRDMHPLETSMDIDIPEGESWMGRGPTPANKYVASAAALAGKNVMSCEDITNTTRVFITTLEAVKMTGDQSIISGVTHSVLHGFNYSPPEAPFPGWVRYGTWFNERNTWWPYFRHWADYKARISYILQQAVPQANVAILQPLNDLWLKHGLQRDPFPRQFYPAYQYEIWKAIHRNGGGCDYVSEKIINEAAFQDGAMVFNGRAYHTLLLPEVETMDPRTAEALLAFAEAGGKIVFLEKMPFKSPYFAGHKENDAKVKDTMEKLLTKYKDRVWIYEAPGEDITGWYGKLQDELEIKPFVRFDHTHSSLMQCCYSVGGTRMFFIANSDLKENFSVKADFNLDKGLIPWVWIPETGGKLRYPVKSGESGIILNLPRATSMLIVFEKDAPGEVFQPAPVFSEGEEISGPWHLTLHHINGDQQELSVDTITDLIEMEETMDFAGTVIYETTFDMDENKHGFIDLGDVQGITELSLNGKLLGTRWYGAHVYDMKEAIISGENKLSVKLTTIVGNYLRTLKDNPVARRWVVYQPNIPMGIIGPVKII